MADLIALVLEVIASIVWETVAWLAKMLFWPARRKETPAAVAREPRALPEDRATLIVAALKAGEDAAAHPPKGLARVPFDHRR